MRKRKLNKRGKKFVTVLFFVIIIIAGLVIYTNVNNNSSAKDEILNKKENKISKLKLKMPSKKINIVDLKSTSRPFAVMINNINVARPLQSGLQDAYIIYEIIVEGGITRYMALFQDQSTQRIGSIRSARHYFLDYALENDAVYVHHGQSDQALQDFNNLNNLDRIVVDNSKTGFRDTSLNVSSEHTLFSNVDKLKNGLDNIRLERNKNYLLKYSSDGIDFSKYDSVLTASNVSIKYSNYTTSSYTYDSVNKVYNRFVNGKEHTDYVTGKQYNFKNIITYQVNNYDLNDGSGKGRQGIDNIGSGEGYYISEGYAVPITWEKKSRESQTIYKYNNGEELVVNDGNTFIQIQPAGQNLTIE